MTAGEFVLGMANFPWLIFFGLVIGASSFVDNSAGAPGGGGLAMIDVFVIRRFVFSTAAPEPQRARSLVKVLAVLSLAATAGLALYLRWFVLSRGHPRAPR